MHPESPMTESHKEPEISVVIPALNEAAVIGETIRHLKEAVREEHEIIVVDDHPTDGTRDVVLACARESPNVRLGVCRRTGVRT